MSQWQFSKLKCLVIIETSVIILFIVAQSLKPLRTSNNTASLTTPIRRGDFSQLSSTRAHHKRKLTWKKGSFCYGLLVNTFHENIPVCGSPTGRRAQVNCRGNVDSNKIAACLYQNLATRPRQLLAMLPTDRDWAEPPKNSINLLQDKSTGCNAPSILSLSGRTQSRDYQIKLAQHLLMSEKLSPKVCDVWINRTTFFHVSNANHIYFRFLDLYNVHKAIVDYGTTNYQVIRIGNLGSHYMFPEFDKTLFPGSLTLEDLQDNGTVCFKKVFLVPRSYQAIPFRCKMDRLLEKHCFKCNGRGLTRSPLQTFRKRVLKACNITEDKNQMTGHPKVVIISRRPYDRWPGDRTPNFKRVLVNEDKMVVKIRQSFPHAHVSVVHMENISLCQQVRHAVEADVMLGVHGAGLVHFWWLREQAMGVELEPTFERSNPSFRMLTTLAGRQYASETITGNSSQVEVDINHLISVLKQFIIMIE